MTNTTTLLDLKQGIFTLMLETSNNTTYTDNGRDTEKINSLVASVCNGYVKSLIDNNIIYKCLDMPFLKKKQYIQIKDAISCSAEVNP